MKELAYFDLVLPLNLIYVDSVMLNIIFIGIKSMNLDVSLLHFSGYHFFRAV